MVGNFSGTILSSGSHHSEVEVKCEHPTCDHGGNLKCDTSDDHIIAGLNQRGISPILRRSRHAPSDGLDEDASDVAPDEQPGVQSGFETRILGSMKDDQVSQDDVHARGQKGRGENETADLSFEARLRPRIVVHDQASDEANSFTEAPQPKGDQESPCTVDNSQAHLNGQAGEEESGKKGVDREDRGIAIESRRDRTLGGHRRTVQMVVMSGHLEG